MEALGDTCSLKIKTTLLVAVLTAVDRERVEVDILSLLLVMIPTKALLSLSLISLTNNTIHCIYKTDTFKSLLLSFLFSEKILLALSLYVLKFSFFN